MHVTIFIVTTIVSTTTSTQQWPLSCFSSSLSPQTLSHTAVQRDHLHLYHITLLFKNLPKICDYTLKENSHFLPQPTPDDLAPGILTAKPHHSHSCTYHFGHIDFLTIPPICYLYCLRAFGLAFPSVWKALIPDISMTLSFFIRSLLSTFSARLSLTIYMKCILNLPPSPLYLCIYLFCLFSFTALVTNSILYDTSVCLFIVYLFHQNVKKTLFFS